MTTINPNEKNDQEKTKPIKSPKKSPKRVIRKPVEEEKEIDEKYLIKGLLERQTNHAQRVREILEKYPFYIDASQPGAGKTAIVIDLAREYGYSVGVIAPQSLRGEWEPRLKINGVVMKFFIGYDSLRTMKGCQPKCGFLKRIDTVTVGKTGKYAADVDFEVTDKFIEAVSGKVLIVFDEFQDIKNLNARSKACRAMMNWIINNDKGKPIETRFALLSGSAFDKDEQPINLMRSLGFIKHSKLYMVDYGCFKLYAKDGSAFGAMEAYNIAQHLNKESAQLIYTKNPPRCKESVHNFVFQLYIHVIQKTFVSAMPGPEVNEDLHDIKNVFYRLPSEQHQKYRSILQEIASIAEYDPVTGTVTSRPGALLEARQKLSELEKGRFNLMIRNTHKFLKENPNSKRILCFNFVESIVRSSQLLKQYNPLLLYGDVKIPQRIANVSKFQEPNLDCRLIIANSCVLKGLNLDDIYGEFPRSLELSPTFSVQVMHQAIGRIYRATTKSKAISRVVYIKGCEHEIDLLSALETKSQILRLTNEQQVEDGVLFPGDYKCLSEKEEGGFESYQLPPRG